MTLFLLATQPSHLDHSLKSIQAPVRSQPMVTGMKLLIAWGSSSLADRPTPHLTRFSSFQRAAAT